MSNLALGSSGVALRSIVKSDRTVIKQTVIKKKVPDSRSGQVNFTEAEEILQNEPVMAGMFTIDTHPTYVLFDSGASHSFMSMGFA